MRPDDGRRGLTFFWILTILAFIALRAPCVSIPLERDEGEYAYIAQRALLGEVPYRDIFDQKPPGVFALYAVPFVLFGQSVEAIHVFMYVCTLVTTVLIAMLVSRIADARAGVLAALAFAVMSIDPRLLATAANTEKFMILATVGMMLCALAGLDTRRRLWWLGCGVCGGLAFWIKQVAIADLAFVAMIPVCGHWPIKGRRAVRSLLLDHAALVAGLVCASIPIIVYFVRTGAWDAFLDCVFLHNFQYVQQVSWSGRWHNLGLAAAHLAGSHWAVWVLSVGGVVFGCRGRCWCRWFLCGWLLFSFVGVSLGGLYSYHYFVQLLPALAALAGLGLARPAGWFASRPVAARYGGWAALVLGVVGPVVLASRAVFAAPSPAAASRAMYRLNPFAQSVAIGRYVKEHSAPDETVFILGSEPQILFYAHRKSASRYIFVYPLTGSFGDALDRQKQVAEEVLRARPRHIVIVLIPTSHRLGRGSELYLWNAVRQWVRDGYRVVGLEAYGPNGLPLTFGEEAAAWFGAHGVTFGTIVYGRRDAPRGE